MSETQVESVEANADPQELTKEERNALYSKWFDVALDADRQLLTLSLACFGVLGTVLAGNVLKTKAHYVLWAIACFAFLVEIALVLTIIFLNKKILTITLSENRIQEMPWLDRCEIASRWMFFGAVLSTAIFLGTIAFSQFDKLPVEPKKEISNEHGTRTIDCGRGGSIGDAKAGSVKGERTDTNSSNASATASTQTPNATSESTKAEALTNDQKTKSMDSDHGGSSENAKAGSVSKRKRDDVETSSASGKRSSKASNTVSGSTQPETLSPESLGEKSR